MAGDWRTKGQVGRTSHAQADGVNTVERRIVQRYNRVMFGVGLAMAVIIPPLIYKWKRWSMSVGLYYCRNLKTEPKKTLRECITKEEVYRKFQENHKLNYCQ